MRFIFDENISGPYLGILSNYDRENSFESSIHLFGQGISDIELFQGIGWLDDNPVLVGYDRRILDQPAERAALREVGIDYIIFTKHWQK